MKNLEPKMHMDWHRIEVLVQKYWEGETSLEEEAELRQALHTENVPANLKMEAELMGFWTQQQEGSLPSVRDHAIQKIHKTRRTSDDSPAKEIGISPFWLRIAATVTLALAIGWWFRQQGTDAKDPVMALAELSEEVDPLETYQGMKEALLFISNKFKKGTEPLATLDGLKKAEESIGQLQKLNRAERILKDQD